MFYRWILELFAFIWFAVITSNEQLSNCRKNRGIHNIGLWTNIMGHNQCATTIFFGNYIKCWLITIPCKHAPCVANPFSSKESLIFFFISLKCLREIWEVITIIYYYLRISHEFSHINDNEHWFSWFLIILHFRGSKFLHESEIFISSIEELFS